MSEFLIVSQPPSKKYRENYDTLYPLANFQRDYKEIQRQYHFNKTNMITIKYRAYYLLHWEITEIKQGMSLRQAAKRLKAFQKDLSHFTNIFTFFSPKTIHLLFAKAREEYLKNEL